MLRERVKTPPPDGGVWIAKKVAAVIAAEPGVSRVAEQRGREALKAIGWTVQRPRPQHVQAATPEEQEAFKRAPCETPLARPCRIFWAPRNAAPDML